MPKAGFHAIQVIRIHRTVIFHVKLFDWRASHLGHGFYEKVVICEGAFLVHNFFIRADIIVKNGDSVKLIEVKSKSTKSGDEYEFLTKRTPYSILSDERPYLADIAFLNQTKLFYESYCF